MSNKLSFLCWYNASIISIGEDVKAEALLKKTITYDSVTVIASLFCLRVFTIQRVSR